jgi:hypothetical protein
MTAVMRAMPAASGPRVLRIGLIQAGKVVEDRIIKQRSTVTAGPSEKSAFVIPDPGLAAFGPSFPLFELVGQDYHLTLCDGMTGRVAMLGESRDLGALRGQARRSPSGAHQIKLSEDARGKVVVGETTFLFQFVAPLPVQPRPQLPASATSSVADSIDWTMTLVAAISFLFHFGAIGSLYSDWADKILPDEANVQGLVASIRLPPPPAAEAPKDDPVEQPVDKPQDPKPTQSPRPTDGGRVAQNRQPPGHVSESDAASISRRLAEMDVAVIGVTSVGPSTRSVIDSGDIPTGPMDVFARSNAGATQRGPGELKLNGGDPMARGNKPTLADGVNTNAVKEAAANVATDRAPPKATVSGSAVPSGSRINGADRVISLARAKARACYQAGLATNPDMEGSVSFSLSVSSSGSVSSASASPSGTLSSSVASCVKGALTSLSFDAPEGGGSSTISGSFKFLNANKGK